MTDSAEIRTQQRRSWNRFSSGWERWDHVLIPMLEPIADEMLRMLDVGEDSEHLDVAAGTGEPGLTIAALVPRGRVVLTDLSGDMLDVARRNAEARGITNVEVRECGADDLPFPDESFDSVSCRFGLMFFPDLEDSVRELRRVLRPGGRLCASVWGVPEDNPWATIPMAAIATEVELPPPSPDAPGLFRCATPGAVRELFESAGLRDVQETEVGGSLVLASADEYWSYMTDVAAPIVAALESLDEPARERIRAIVIDRAREYGDDGAVRIPLLAHCAVATR